MGWIDESNGIAAKLFKEGLDKGKMSAAKNGRIGTGTKDRFRILLQRAADFRPVEDAPFDEISQGRAGLFNDFNMAVHSRSDLAVAVIGDG